jgi:hypothetical protein
MMNTRHGDILVEHRGTKGRPIHIAGDKSSDSWLVIRIENDGDQSGREIASFDSETCGESRSETIETRGTSRFSAGQRPLGRNSW